LSFNDGRDAVRGGIYFFPRVFTLNNYKVILSGDRFITSFGLTSARTVVGTLTSLAVTSMAAYAISKKYLALRKFYTILFIITMYFGGGLIPTYIWFRSLGLRNNFLVYILPGLVSVWNMLIFRSFFQDIPSSFEESARVDGANNLTIFVRIIIPLSMPVYAALALFTAVGHWNEWFTAVLYIDNRDLLPLQTILNQMINQITAIEELARRSAYSDTQRMLQSITTRSLVTATMIVVTAPIIAVYPFLQKYFVKGIMLGGIKG
jgi:putative aldouronate transport system permease protein